MQDARTSSAINIDETRLGKAHSRRKTATRLSWRSAASRGYCQLRVTERQRSLRELEWIGAREPRSGATTAAICSTPRRAASAAGHNAKAPTHDRNRRGVRRSEPGALLASSKHRVNGTRCAPTNNRPGNNYADASVTAAAGRRGETVAFV